MAFNALDNDGFKEYHRLTKGMEFQFMLPSSFMTHCEQIVFGNEYKDLSYFCFHLYTDAKYCEHYERLSQAMEYAYNETDSDKFKNLANNLSNLLIFLREPQARATDLDYIAENLAYWRDMVTGDELLTSNKGFRKYVLK